VNSTLMPFVWVALSLPILWFLQRWIHRHLHGVAFLLSGNKNWAVVLYAIILFPGVLLHEVSHWLTATLLGVRTGSFSVLPRTKSDGSVQLGYVEYYKTSSVGPIRESLIGSAPLVVGTAVILLIGLFVFDVTTLAASVEAGDLDLLTQAISEFFATGDFLLWLYLIFAISNAMMPSASDRRAWPAFALILIAFAVLLYVLRLQTLFFSGVVGPASTVFGYLGLAFSLTIGVDLFFMLAIHLLEWLVSRLKGVDLVYGNSDTPPG
jgi:hypothetical protein